MRLTLEVNKAKSLQVRFGEVLSRFTYLIIRDGLALSDLRRHNPRKRIAGNVLVYVSDARQRWFGLRFHGLDLEAYMSTIPSRHIDPEPQCW